MSAFHLTTASDTTTERAHLWSAIRADRPHQQAPVRAETQKPVAKHQQLQGARAVAAQPPDAAAGSENSTLRRCIWSACQKRPQNTSSSALKPILETLRG